MLGCDEIKCGRKCLGEMAGDGGILLKSPPAPDGQPAVAQEHFYWVGQKGPGDKPGGHTTEGASESPNEMGQLITVEGPLKCDSKEKHKVWNLQRYSTFYILFIYKLRLTGIRLHS